MDSLPSDAPALAPASSTDSNVSAAEARALRRAKILARGENRLNLLKGTAEKIEEVPQEQLQTSAAALLAKEQQERAAVEALEKAEKLAKEKAQAARQPSSASTEPSTASAAESMAQSSSSSSAMAADVPASTSAAPSAASPAPSPANPPVPPAVQPKATKTAAAAASRKPSRSFFPSTATIIRGMISLLPVLLGLWMAHAWHRCGGFESVPMRLAAMERAAIAGSEAATSSSSSSSSSSLLKAKMAAKFGGDSFVVGSSSSAGSGSPILADDAALAAAASPSSSDIDLRAIGGVLCQAGDRGWFPIVVVLIFGLRFLVEKNTKFLLESSPPSSAPRSRAAAAANAPSANDGSAAPSSSSAPAQPQDPMAMLQQLMMPGGRPAGVGGFPPGFGDGANSGNPLSSLASKASAAMEAWRLLKAFAFDWLVFTVVFVLGGAALEWFYFL